MCGAYLSVDAQRYDTYLKRGASFEARCLLDEIRYTESLINTLYIVTKYKRYKNFLRKNALFFFRELQLITVSFLIHNPRMC